MSLSFKNQAWAQLVSSTDISTPPVLIYLDKFVLGRNSDCDLGFPGNKLVSGKHCYLKRSDYGKIWLHDTSTNGTLINLSIKISKGKCEELKHGDEFHIVHNKACPSDDIAFIFQDLKALGEESTSDSDNTIDYTFSQADNTIEDEEINDLPDTDHSREKPDEKINDLQEMDQSRKRKGEDSTGAGSAKKINCISKPDPATTELKQSEVPDPAKPETTEDHRNPQPAEVEADPSSAKITKKPPCKEECDEMEDTLLCSICTELLHDCVSLQPCMHSYCGGCYSEWMERSNECPSCRMKVERINKNHIVNNLVTAYLKTKPEKQRPQEDLNELNWKNKITRDMLYPEYNSKGMTVGSFDFESDDEADESDVEMDLAFQNAPVLPGAYLFHNPLLPLPGFRPQLPPAVICRQCPNYKEDNPVQVNIMQAGPSGADDSNNKLMPEPPPFSCGRNQNHILCLCCLKPMPDRHGEYLRGGLIPPQQCSICFRGFCHAYWGCRKAECNGCLGMLKDMNFGKTCPPSLILNNPFESIILQKHLEKQGVTVKHLLGDCLAKLVTGEYTLPNTAALNNGINSIVCYSCGLKTFGELAYLYRRDIPQTELPDDTSRPNCYWGKNCRTQRNKPDHARRFNHICEQTRAGV